jgi:BirA family transcriptional regulator, biotin operon repressor / biotin---[acetyl-CoA-carboxylase] ligase
LELAREGAAEGSVVVAGRQTRGRGQGSRSWESPEGGLYLSVVLRPPTPSPLLPLAIGSGIADAVSLDFRVRLRLKWPNDLLHVDGGGIPRKLAGILVDGTHGPDGAFAAVAGVGVNVRPSPGLRSLDRRAVALEELSGGPVDLDRVESGVVRSALGARAALSEPAGERAVLARVRGLLYGVGEAVTVDGVPAGALAGLRDDGALELATADGARSVLAGDVRVGVGP